MKKYLRHLIPLCMFLIMSCSSDSISDLIEEEEKQEVSRDLTYVADIKPIIDSRCLSCHSSPTRNGAPFSLTTYDEVKLRAESGLLLTAISRSASSPGIMPPSGRLSQTVIDEIAQWIEDGLLEN